MPGLYIHIPFCKSRCIYCDFFSTTMLERRAEYVDALCTELHERRTEAKTPHHTIGTIYIGGGTPTQLSPEQTSQIMQAIRHDYDVDPDAEITIEANPSDITPDTAHQLLDTGFNRVSLGIQTFDNHLLHLINRRHDAKTAIEAVHTLRQAGFSNISIDLIYALPRQTMPEWAADVQQAINLHPEHISAYTLMYEEHTQLYQMLQKKQIEETDEETALSMYRHLCNQLRDAGYHHYEISNFSQPGRHSRHNSNYWNDTPYIGIGAGAHSYDGNSRRQNLPHLDTYIHAIRNHTTYYETEQLTTTNKFNETLMTRLRTSQGLNLSHLEQRFGTQLRQYVEQQAKPYIESRKLHIDLPGPTLRLTEDGIFTSNDIIATLFAP
ncbi:MAG: radical SAM family heme chaperone HemW [Bacteroidaceae bacterium]|nr:radical SAM family heme chaperone HemW [Bacteroidaceae bacterium]